MRQDCVFITYFVCIISFLFHLKSLPLSKVVKKSLLFLSFVNTFQESVSFVIYVWKCFFFIQYCEIEKLTSSQLFRPLTHFKRKTVKSVALINYVFFLSVHSSPAKYFKNWQSRHTLSRHHPPKYWQHKIILLSYLRHNILKSDCLQNKCTLMHYILWSRSIADWFWTTCTRCSKHSFLV